MISFFIAFCLGLTLAFCLSKFLVLLSKDSPEMRRKRYITRMLNDGFKRNELGHWVKDD